MNRIHRTLFCLAAVAGLAFAQGPRGGGAMSPSGRGGAGYSTLAMTKTQTVAGPVTVVSIGYGAEYPSLTVNKLQIKAAPVWYLLEKNFEIQTGDNVSIVAAPSTVASDPYLYAIEITNTATKAHIVLRDGNGLPLWSQRGGACGNGPGPMADGPCGVLSIATETGVVEQVAAGPGVQMPSLTLKTAAGGLLTVKLGPERLLLKADLELKAGDTISVKYAVTSHDGELVALAITKGPVTVTLRGDDCRPIWD